MELKHIGRYDIKSLIGQGGMSAVYLGYDPRALREVAIKILPPYYLHAPKFRERFEREALTIALLEHPAIVPVYDMGEEDGQPYIVMRYMSGGSLAEKLNRGSLGLKECTDMYQRLAPALDTAHARGVTHRDVKPDNLLFDKYDNVFLSDFGLARLRETIGFANISDGSILGTPAYMSPEQIQGDRQINGLSDIYSMGVVLYHMLAGEVPFNGPTAASVMMAHLINPVPQIHDHNSSLPLAIQVVLETAMAKNPQDRYQTALDFARALQAVAAGAHKAPTAQAPAAVAVKKPEKRSTLVMPPKASPAAVVAQGPDSKTSLTKPDPPTRGKLAAFADSLGKTFTFPAVIPMPRKAGKLNTAVPQSVTLKRKRSIFPRWGWIAGAAIFLLLSGSLVLWALGSFPFSLLPDSNPEVDNALVLGQADKLAFLKGSDIWVSNLDGSQLIQLTADSQPKASLQWSPDGQSLVYTSANCIHTVQLETRQTLNRTCFSSVPSIDAFDISPDGRTVALGMASSELYLLPYSQLFRLRPASLPEDILSLAQCSYYAPYRLQERLKAINWSMDNSHLALLISRTVDGAVRDEINVFDFSQCSASPPLVSQILPTTFLFTLRSYYTRPEISSVSWNQDDQLLTNGSMNETGFGDLHLYNLEGNSSQQIAPNGTCCYRDAYWSPDGTYLFYTFQPEGGDEISLYYLPTDQLYQPASSLAALALPAGFFTGDLASLQPALRAVH